MLVKLIKFHTNDLTHYANEAFDDIRVHICDGISDWEEIDENEYYIISDWIKNQKSHYMLVTKPETPLKFIIKEEKQRQKELEKKRKEKEEKRKQEIEEKRLKRQKNKEERERKKLEELKKKYEKNSN